MLYLSDYTYYVFQEIEKRGLQFLLPPEWKDMYRLYLKQKKIEELIRQVEELAENRYHEPK